MVLVCLGFMVACGPIIGSDDEVAEAGGPDDTTSASTMTSASTGTDENESLEPEPPDMPPPPPLPSCDDIPISMPVAELVQARLEPGMGGSMRLRLSKHDFECGGSFHYPECGGTWNVSIGIPPEAQQPGIYDLADFNIGYTDAPLQQEPSCTGSSTGGGPGNGTMEILAWHDECIAVRFTGVQLATSFDLDGEAVASACL
jgi:hypothetical protein